MHVDRREVERCRLARTLLQDIEFARYSYAYHGAQETEADEDITADDTEEPSGHNIRQPSHDSKGRCLERRVDRVIPTYFLKEDSNNAAQTIVTASVTIL